MIAVIESALALTLGWNAAEQIVGPERRLRLLHLDWSGEV
jgi:hypothetical protein